jgi:hypothetical protein
MRWIVVIGAVIFFAWTCVALRKKLLSTSVRDTTSTNRLPTIMEG